jgi:hypothetical protein
MFYIIYLITNEKQYSQIDSIYKMRRDNMINNIDHFIEKYHFDLLFGDMSESLVQEIKKDVSAEFKNIDKEIKQVFKTNDVGIIKIDLIQSLKRKKINEMETIFELNPVLSYILKEGSYNKNIVYDEVTLKKCQDINTNTKLIFVSTYTLLYDLKKLIKAKKIHKEIYFKTDFKTPIEYMIYEYTKILDI